MTVKEAIKEIIKLRGLLIFNDYNKFKAMLLDFGNSNQKELNVFKTAVDEKMLKLCIDDSLENSRKITKIKIQLEDKGFSDNTIDFVIESFAFALGWNYTQSKQLQSQKAQPQHASSSTDWTCVCGTVNTANFCGNCGSAKPVPKSLDWTCSCGTVNTTNFCINCGKKKGEKQTQQIQQNVQQNPTKNQAQQTNYIEVTLDETVLKQLGYYFRYENKRCYNERKYLQKAGLDISVFDIPSTYIYNGKNYKITQIGYEAFSSCSSLTSVTIPNSVIRIGKFAFAHCRSLTSVMIPSSVKEIAGEAFSNCWSLVNVKMSNGLEEIGCNAFCRCFALTSLIIPNSVTKIGNYAFDNIETVYYDGYAENSTWGANIVINKNFNYIEVRLSEIVLKHLGYDVSYKRENNRNINLLNFKKNGQDVTILDIPDTYFYNGYNYKIVQIADRTFSGCSSLTSVTIPNSVTEIDWRAFSSCSSLTSVIIPNSVTKIGMEAFSNCSSLTSVTIPNSVIEIGDSAFSSCSSLTSVTIPNSVIEIGNRAFCSCSSLTNITIPNSVTKIGEGAFYGIPHIEYHGTATYVETWFGDFGDIDKYWGALSMN